MVPLARRAESGAAPQGPEETEARPAADFTHCHLKFKLNQLDSGTQGVSLAPGIQSLPKMLDITNLHTVVLPHCRTGMTMQSPR